MSERSERDAPFQLQLCERCHRGGIQAGNDAAYRGLRHQKSGTERLRVFLGIASSRHTVPMQHQVPEFVRRIHPIMLGGLQRVEEHERFTPEPELISVDLWV